MSNHPKIQDQSEIIVRYKNCSILYNKQIQKRDLWTRNGIIIDPKILFFKDKKRANVEIDCLSSIISPGFIDIQINGAIGVDFSMPHPNYQQKLDSVSKFLLSHGVTSFCPTLVTSSLETYEYLIPRILKRNGGKHGAGILGIHLEGPFIAQSKKGAHCGDLVYEKADLESLIHVYDKDLSNVAIVTIAPELTPTKTLEYLTHQNIVVSIGHSNASLEEALHFVQNGASLITHLFNAMAPFHHRYPNIIGLLPYSNASRRIFYSIIIDLIHVHPASIKMAHSSNPDGIVLVTDAMSAMGLQEGVHKIGTINVDLKADSVTVQGTNILAGSVTTIPSSLQKLVNSLDFTVADALGAVTSHPAELLGIQNRKGSLDFNSDADFVILSHEMIPLVTVIAGIPVWQQPDSKIDLSQLIF